MPHKPLFGESRDRSRFESFLHGERVVIIMAEHAFPSIMDLVNQAVDARMANNAANAPATASGVTQDQLDSVNARIDALEQNLDDAFAQPAPVDVTPGVGTVDVPTTPPDTNVQVSPAPSTDTTAPAPADPGAGPSDTTQPAPVDTGAPVDVPPGAMPTGN